MRARTCWSRSPRGSATAQIERLIGAEERTGLRVKVGFNHRFHPGLMRAAAEVHSGEHGELFHVRGRYGHGGRLGYDGEWRTQTGALRAVGS